MSAGLEEDAMTTSTKGPNSRRAAPLATRTLAAVALAAPLAIAPLALLSACGVRPGPRMLVARATHRLASDVKHESTIVVGQELATELVFSAGTGYAWIATGFDADVLRLKGQQSKSEAPDGVVGGQMAEHFVFEGVAPGETTIVFELRRPWETDVAPADTRTMKVRVTAAKAGTTGSGS